MLTAANNNAADFEQQRAPQLLLIRAALGHCYDYGQVANTDTVKLVRPPEESSGVRGGGLL